MNETVGDLAGLDILPLDIRDKSVKDLLDLSGRRALVTAEAVPVPASAQQPFTGWPH